MGNQNAKNEPIADWDDPVCVDNLSFILKNYVRLTGIYIKTHSKQEEYFQDLIDEYQRHHRQIEFTGSHFEGLKIPHAATSSLSATPPKELLSDLDFMLIDCKKTIGHQNAKNTKNACYACVDSTNCHQGYLQLRLSENGTLLRCQDLIGTTIHAEDVKHFYFAMKGVRSYFSLNPIEVEARYTEQLAHGPAITVSLVNSGERFSTYNTAEIDLVASLHCAHWPEEATEWVTRQRDHGWPSKGTIDGIVAAGFHMVPVPHHKSCNKDTEFRFSFSNAEKTLARSLNTAQRCAYLLMKILHYHHLKPLGVISSYHMKTCLLWSCEETTADVWTMDNLGRCFLMLMNRVKSCLFDHNLPNYFIPGNNMLDHIERSDVLKVHEVISELLRDPLKPLFKVAGTYNTAFEKDYVALESVLDSQCLLLYRNPRVGGRYNPLPLMHQVTGAMHVRSKMKEIAQTPQKLRVMIKVCLVHLLTGMRDDTVEVALQPFLELQALLKDYGGFTQRYIPLCFIVSTMAIQMLTSRSCPQSITRNKAQDVRLALQKIFKLHGEQPCCKRACYKILLYILMLDRSNIGVLKKAMQPLTFDSEEFEKLTNDEAVCVMYANYLIQHGHPDEALKVLPKVTDKVTVNFCLIPWQEPAERLGCKAYCLMLMGSLRTINASALPHSSLVWTGIISLLPSLDVPLAVVVNYLSSLASFQLSDYLGCATGARRLAAAHEHSKAENPGNMINILQLTGHALYMAGHYKEAIEYLSKVLSSTPCTVSAMYIVLCSVKLKVTHFKFDIQILSSLYHAIELDNIEVMLKILSPMSLEDIISLADFLFTKSFSALTLAVARILHLRLVQCEEQEDAKVELKKIAVDFEPTEILSLPKEVIAKYVRQCYVHAAKDSPDIGVHACFICFLATIPSVADAMAHLACLLPHQRRQNQPGRTVRYFKHEKAILPKNLQKEFETADVYEVPADFLILFSIQNAAVRSSKSEVPKGAMALVFGNGAKLVSHESNIPFGSTLVLLMKTIMDAKAIKRHLSKWTKRLVFLDQEHNPLWLIPRQIHHTQTIHLLAQIFIEHSLFKEAEHDAELAIEKYPGHYTAAMATLQKSKSKAITPSYIRFKQGKFDEAFSAYKLAWKNSLSICSDQCSLLLHYAGDIWSVWEIEEDVTKKLGLKYLEYLIDSQASGIPSDHIEHIKVTLALLYFHRYNELKNRNETAQGEDTGNGASTMQDDKSQTHDVLQNSGREAEDSTPEEQAMAISECKPKQNAGHPQQEHDKNKSKVVRDTNTSRVEPTSEFERCLDPVTVAAAYKDVLVCLKDEEVKEADNLSRGISILKGIVEESQCSGVSATVLGNILFLEKSPAEAKDVLQQAVRLGLAQIPLHVRHFALHHLVTEERTSPAHTLMTCEKMFELLVASNKEGYYTSYLVYASYLLSLCYISEGEMQIACDSFEEIVQLVGHCLGKDALFGILCMKAGQYVKAQQSFQAEIKAQDDLYEKKSLLQSMEGICHFAETIKNCFNQERAKYVCQKWFEELEDTEAVLHMTTRNLNYVHSIEQSAANFIIQLLPKNPDLVELQKDKAQEMYKHLCSVLSEDSFLGCIHFQHCVILIDKYSALSETEKMSRPELLQEIEENFKESATKNQFPIHSASFSFGCLLLQRGKYEKALEVGVESYKVCMKVINNYVEDRSSEQESVVAFILNKCLNKCLVVMCVSYACLLRPQELIKLLKDTYAVTDTLHENPPSDVVVAACSHIPDLIAFKQTDALIRLHECLLEQFPDSIHASSLAGNLACYLFGRMRESNQSNNDPATLSKITEVYVQALAGSPSAATYADYMNYLYNTEQYELLASTWDKVKSEVSQMAVSQNSYSGVEKLTVDEFLRQEVEHHGEVWVNSYEYCVYLDTCGKYKQQGKGQDELAQLRELAENNLKIQKLVGYIYLTMGKKEEARAALDKVITGDAAFQWMIPLYFEHN